MSTARAPHWWLIAGALSLIVSRVAAAAPLGEQARERMWSSGVVGASVVDAFGTEEKARVMIAFTIPNEVNGSSARRFDTPAMRSMISSVRTGIVNSFAPGEFELRRMFRSVNAVAGEISSAGVLRLLDNPNILRVDLDEGGTGGSADPLPLVHLDVLHIMGLTGKGVTAAVLDTGVDTNHPDLSDDLVAQQCFCSSISGPAGCCPNGSSSQNGAGSAEDDNGHGTNVSGTITSDGTIAPVGGAPNAKLVAIKVMDSHNRFCCTSDIVAGLDWIINNRPEVKIINMSLGTTALFAGDCDDANASTMAFATAINTLRANGVSTFASSLNEGSGTRMSAPACVHNAISVGAVYNDNVGSFTFIEPPLAGCTDNTTQADKVTCFSNSDVETDVFAPGCPTTSTGIGNGTSTFCGTSQASPLVAACAACLLQANPNVSPDQLELALKTSPTLVAAPRNGLTFPRLDCEAALASLAAPTPTYTPIPTPTPTLPTPTWSLTPTVTPTTVICTGDCNSDGQVTVDEILAMVNIALGNAAVSTCPAGDANGDGHITVDEILTAVNNALSGCPGATPTP